MDDTILDALVRHGGHLHRAASATVNDVLEHLDNRAPGFVSELSERLESLTPGEASAFAAGRITTSRLKGIDNLISEFVSTFEDHLNSTFDAAAKELVQHEVGYTAELLTRSGFEGEPPAAGKVLSAALATPVAGATVKETLDEITRTLSKRTRATVRQGLADGQSASNIATAIKGTDALKRKDGTLQTTRNSIDRDLRTVRSHLSAKAGDETYQALGIREVIHTSTLDNRVCVECASLDGKVYRLDEPKPNATRHPRCRCFYRPKVPGGDQGERPYVRAEKVRARGGKREPRSIGRMTPKQRRDAGLEVGQVDASVKFPEWLAQQDAAFQKDWLGPTRYKLWKEGGYRLDKFVDPRGKTLNLDELRQKDRETFKQLFAD